MKQIKLNGVNKCSLHYLHNFNQRRNLFDFVFNTERFRDNFHRNNKFYNL